MCRPAPHATPPNEPVGRAPRHHSPGQRDSVDATMSLALRLLDGVAETTHTTSTPSTRHLEEGTAQRLETNAVTRDAREKQSLASFLAPAYSSRQTRFLTAGSGMRARTRRSCTVMRRDPIIFARDILTLSSPFASAHFTFCTMESHRTLT